MGLAASLTGRRRKGLGDFSTEEGTEEQGMGGLPLCHSAAAVLTSCVHLSDLAAPALTPVCTGSSGRLCSNGTSPSGEWSFTFWFITVERSYPIFLSYVLLTAERHPAGRAAVDYLSEGAVLSTKRWLVPNHLEFCR